MYFGSNFDGLYGPRQGIHITHLKYAFAKGVGYCGVYKFKWSFVKYQPTGLDKLCIDFLYGQIMRKPVSQKPSEGFTVMHLPPHNKLFNELLSDVMTKSWLGDEETYFVNHELLRRSVNDEHQAALWIFQSS